MTLTQHDAIEQRSPEWHDQRRGMVTASAVGRLISVRPASAVDHDCPDCGATASELCWSKTKKTEHNKTFHAQRTDYAVEHASELPPRIDVADNDTSAALTLLLTAERISGWTDPSFINDDMMRGILDEPLAIEKYHENYHPVTTTGFMVRDDWGFDIGFSPDGLVSALVGDEGIVEVKSRRQKKHVQTILSGSVPAENMAQLQCGLLVSGRKWADYISFCSGLPLWVKRVQPDPAWFRAIIAAVQAFEDTSGQMVSDYLAAVDGLPTTERIDHFAEMEMS